MVKLVFKKDDFSHHMILVIAWLKIVFLDTNFIITFIWINEKIFGAKILNRLYQTVQNPIYLPFFVDSNAIHMYLANYIGWPIRFGQLHRTRLYHRTIP